VDAHSTFSAVLIDLYIPVGLIFQADAPFLKLFNQFLKVVA
jgi:hypothetical protein